MDFSFKNGVANEMAGFQSSLAILANKLKLSIDQIALGRPNKKIPGESGIWFSQRRLTDGL
jgi:hypothetical protein